jgi:hypothetical protein
MTINQYGQFNHALRFNPKYVQPQLRRKHINGPSKAKGAIEIK